MLKSIKIIAAAILLFSGGAAVAVPIGGEIQFGGVITLDAAVGSANAVSGVESVTGDVGKATVTVTTGDFATYVGSSLANYSTFAFDTNFDNSDIETVNIASLWSVDGFTFDLDTVWIEYQDASNLLLGGTGVIKNALFDDTFGSWTLSTDGSGATVTFSSSSTGSTTVPAPATLALLGFGLIGLAAVRRRKAV